MNSMNPARPRLGGKTVVISGAGSSGKGIGIGRAMAAHFAEEGARVFAIDVNVDSLTETVSMVREAGGLIESEVVDVADPVAVTSAIGRCIEVYGAIDALINNVGIAGTGGAREISLQEWNRQLSVNLSGAFHTCRAVLPFMERAGGGSIVNVSSLLAHLSLRRIANIGYAASKAGLEQMTRVIAVEYARNNVRANNLILGLIDTPQVRLAFERRRALHPEAAEQVWGSRSRMAPVERQGTPLEVARAAAFLASDDASYITGADLRIDGGLALLLD